MPTRIQRNFAGGEIAPDLGGRSDQVKYDTGLKACRNFLVTRYGSAVNRPGTRFVAETKNSGVARLIEFVFNDDQTYVLEFGDQYMRVIRAGAQLESSGSPYEIATPYLEADLFDIQFAQSGDVITLTHEDYEPRNLTRTGHTSWSLDVVDFLPTVSRPQSCSASGTSGSSTYRYRITALDKDTSEESLAGLDAAKNITAITQANPAQVTVTNHYLQTGDVIYIESVAGMTELNNRSFTVTYVDADNFTLDGENSTGYTAYSSGGTIKTARAIARMVQTLSTSNKITITWSAVTNASVYYVYREQNGIYGYLGTAQSTTYDDDGSRTPDLSEGPPIERNPFVGSGNYPSAVGFIQQRKCYGATANEPEKIWMSRIGRYGNFTSREPLTPDDSFSFVISGREVNQVRHILEVSSPIIITSGGSFVLKGSGDGAISFDAINPRQNGYLGASRTRPIISSSDVLFTQNRNRLVYSMRYSLERDGFVPGDLTLYAPHLFRNYTISDWAYQEVPDSTVWAVRSDGTLIAMTYLPDQQVIGWHRHDTVNGSFESVCTVPEGNEDAVYFVVKRTIDGNTVRYIERLETRNVTDVEVDAFFVDSGLSYDGRGDGSETMTLTGGTSWLATETLTMTRSSGGFVSGDVGNQVMLISDTDRIRCTITAYTSSTVVSVKSNKTVPAEFQATAITNWRLAKDVMTGLDHLEGETVAILRDGNAESQKVVSSGSITLDEPGGIVHIGLPITADLETLRIDTPTTTILDKEKNIKNVYLLIQDSRGAFVGSDYTKLEELKQSRPGDEGDVIPLESDLKKISFKGKWAKSGEIVIRQSYPLPLTILSVIIDFEVQ